MSAENQTHESSGSPSVEEATNELLNAAEVAQPVPGRVRDALEALLAACRAESAAGDRDVR